MVRVVVATTEGPSEVLRVTAEDPALRSVVCLGRTTTTLPISRAYDAFVRSPSGVVERAVGHPAFRVDVSAPIDDGDSWQLGLYLAHRLKAAGRLAEGDAGADLALWATGRVDSDLLVHPVDRVDEKLRRSAGLFAAPQTRILAVVPVAQAEALAALPDNVESLVVGAVGPVLRHLGLDPPMVWRPRRRRAGWPWGAVAAAVIAAAAVTLVPWPSKPPPDPLRATGEGEAPAGRPLDAVYLVVHFDTLPVTILEAGQVRNSTAHVALAIAADGRRDVLGAWVAGRNGTAPWPVIAAELRSRGVEDVVLALSDDPDGLEALRSAFPRTAVLTGVVGMIRETLASVAPKDRRAAGADLKVVYHAGSSTAAAAALDAFAATWGARYPAVVERWRNDRSPAAALPPLPPQLRVLATATGALDELNRSLRRALDERGGFDTDAAAVRALLEAAAASGVDGRRMAGWSATLAGLRPWLGDRLPPAAP